MKPKVVPHQSRKEGLWRVILWEDGEKKFGYDFAKSCFEGSMLECYAWIQLNEGGYL